jgi:hypothetical protein
VTGVARANGAVRLGRRGGRAACRLLRRREATGWRWQRARHGSAHRPLPRACTKCARTRAPGQRPHLHRVPDPDLPFLGVHLTRHTPAMSCRALGDAGRRPALARHVAGGPALLAHRGRAHGHQPRAFVAACARYVPERAPPTSRAAGRRAPGRWARRGAGRRLRPPETDVTLHVPTPCPPRPVTGPRASSRTACFAVEGLCRGPRNRRRMRPLRGRGGGSRAHSLFGYAMKKRQMREAVRRHSVLLVPLVRCVEPWTRRSGGDGEKVVPQRRSRATSAFPCSLLCALNLDEPCATFRPRPSDGRARRASCASPSARARTPAAWAFPSADEAGAALHR